MKQFRPTPTKILFYKKVAGIKNSLLDFNAEFNKIIDALAGMLRRIRSLFTGINDSTQQLASSSKELTDTGKQVIERGIVQNLQRAVYNLKFNALCIQGCRTVKDPQCGSLVCIER